MINIALLGFKMAVNDGLTIFNLMDGIVDEFHSEGGIDTAENSNATYDATSDFYSNQSGPNPVPAPQAERTSFTTVATSTYTVPATTTGINVLVVGGGGAGAPSSNVSTHTFVSGITNGISRSANTVGIATASIAFRCSSDYYKSIQYYPRTTDEAHNATLSIKSATDDSIIMCFRDKNRKWEREDAEEDENEVVTFL